MRTAFAAAAAALFFGGSAQAAVVDPVAMLKSFSVIALGDYDLRSDQPAPAFVGGNMTGSHSVNQNGGYADATVGDATGALMVGGTLSGFNNNVRGGVALGQDQGLAQPNSSQRFYTLSNGSTLNLQNGNGTAADAVDVPVDEVRNAMIGLSHDLSQRDDAGTISTTLSGSNNFTYGVTAGTDGYALLNLTLAEAGDMFGLGLGGDRKFVNGDTTVILNIAGSVIDMNWQGTNFNDNAPNLSQNVIFNFYEATELSIFSTFGYSIMAPLANIDAWSGGSNGFLVGNDIIQQYEVRRPFGDIPPPPPSAVPLPAAGWLLVAGVAALAAAGRRRTT